MEFNRSRKERRMENTNRREMNILRLIRHALWGTEGTSFAISSEEYEELKNHTVLSLLTPVIKHISMPPELRKAWNELAVQQLNYNVNMAHLQANLPLRVPYVILKGTSAARYYPHPEYRTMGDIDLMTRREDLNKAYHQMVEGGYDVLKSAEKEICLVQNGTVVELHRRFATLSDPKKAKCMDDMIIDHINDSRILPDAFNGLTILEHINQHLEGGLGLRQIIDWMMFVNQCLTDEKWPEFKQLTEKIGLTNLAVTTTRMCEIYLGLPRQQWCSGADEDLCEQLLDYVLLCGNFGNKKTTDKAISENAFAYARSPRTVFRMLQRQGVENWNAARRFSVLRPFAWIYQAFRYAHRGLKRDRAVTKIKSEYSNAMKRRKMFEVLGVNMTSKGIAVLKDGKYVKR